MTRADHARGWPSMAAALACLAIIGVGVGARLGPGEVDDKTALFMGSAIGVRSAPELLRLRAEVPRIVQDCGGSAHCEWRTRTRLSGLLNYLALGQTIRAAWSLPDGGAPWCRRLARAFVSGTFGFHLLLYLLFVALLWSDRSPGRTYGVLALSLLLAALLQVLAPPGPHAPAMPLGHLLWVEPRHSVVMFVPRGALGLLFVMQVACFASGRTRAWAGLTVLSLFVHTMQSMILNTVFIGAAALRVVAGERSREVAGQLVVLLVVEGLGLLLARALGAGLGVSLVPARSLASSIGPHALLFGGIGAAGLLLLLVSPRARALARAPGARLLLVGIPACVLLAGLDVASRTFSTVPLAKVAFERLHANVAPIFGAVPLLAATLALRALAGRRRVPAPSLGTATALVACLALAIVVPWRANTLARWWRLARTHQRTVPAEFCRLVPEPVRVDAVGAIHPRPEIRFHLQIFDWLDRGGRPARGALLEPRALRRGDNLPSCARRT